jgi:hypothetical protein
MECPRLGPIQLRDIGPEMEIEPHRLFASRENLLEEK